MSDSIALPFEIQVEIIERISDVKSLIIFRSVSKQWKSFIDSPRFIARYHTRHHNHRLLCTVNVDSKEKYVSFVDDDSFPQQHNIGTTVKIIHRECLLEKIITTTSQGLICLYTMPASPRNDDITKSVLLWNPAIRKWVHVDVPNVLFTKYRYKTVIGFGVSPHTNDPMLLKIICTTWSHPDTISCIPWQVEVFTLSTGVWRSLRTNLPPRKSIEFSDNGVAIDRFIYWIGYDLQRSMVMSFDMTSEEFTEIPLPDDVARLSLYYSDISKLGESLVVLQTVKHMNTQDHVVWIMEHGVPNSFRRLFTIKAPDASIERVYAFRMSSIERVYGFRMSGEPIVQRFSRFGKQYVTSVYKPCSQHFDDIVISGISCVNSVSSYTETLLLLDHLENDNLLKHTVMNT